MTNKYPNSGTLFTPPDSKKGLYDGQLILEGYLVVQITLDNGTTVEREFFCDVLKMATRKDGSALDRPIYPVRIKEKEARPNFPDEKHSGQAAMKAQHKASAIVKPIDPKSQVIDDEVPF